MAMELIQDDDRTWGGKEGQELGATVYMNEGAPTWGGGQRMITVGREIR